MYVFPNQIQMKIGFVVFEVPWTYMGGVEIHTVELAKALSRLGEEVQIYTRAYKGQEKRVEMREGVEINYVPVPTCFEKLKEVDYLHFKRLLRPIFKKSLKKEIDTDIDIIHSQHYNGSSMANMDTPLVATIHTSIPQEYRDGRLPLPRGFPQRVLVSLDMLKSLRFHAKFDKTIVVSEKVKEELDHFYGVDAKVIPNGAPKPDKVDKEEAREHLGIENFDRVVLYFGRMERVKGPHRLLNVLEDDELKDVGIVYGGKGGFLPELRSRIARKGLEDRVKLLGFVDEEDKKYCFSAADCFALPSESEGQPITLLEAISYGLPCYVTDKRWIPEYIRDCGVDGDIKEGIKKALDMDVDGSRVKDWTDIAEETLDIYKKLV